ncbi:serine/threonine protein kinase with PASTA sensor(s), partial [Rhodopirellula maiorica SM1]
MIDLLHPPVKQIREFGLGRLQTSDTDEIAIHVDQCDRCCEHLRVLPDDDFVERIRDLANCELFEQLECQAQSDLAERDAKHDLAEILTDHPRYRVIRQIGAGGMGEVYLAEHMVLNRTVALKVIRRAWRDHSSGSERFRREMQAVARLSHPNIVTAYDAEPLGESAVLAMEYVRGETLDEYVDRVGPRPVDEANILIEQAAAALHHAHQHGLVHRDVKPQNIIRTPDGMIKVLDFGLAQLKTQAEPVHEDLPQEDRDSTDLTHPGMRLGTPEFRSPEQSTGGPVDVHSDVYGLGAVYSYLLLGRTESRRLRESFAKGRTKEALTDIRLPKHAKQV